MIYLWIALGSAVGGCARYALAGLIASTIEEAFPWGTLVVNVTGCFAIGLLATLNTSAGGILTGPTARVMLMVGFCGGYTTFSSFSLQTLVLLRNGDWPRAGAYIAASVLLCMVGVWLGHLAAAGLNQLKGA